MDMARSKSTIFNEVWVRCLRYCANYNRRGWNHRMAHDGAEGGGSLFMSFSGVVCRDSRLSLVLPPSLTTKESLWKDGPLCNFVASIPDTRLLSVTPLLPFVIFRACITDNALIGTPYINSSTGGCMHANLLV